MPRSKKTYESLQEGKADVVFIGKEQSFDYFFRQHYTGLCFFAVSIIHNEEDAKDIVQDCFIKLWDDDSIIEKANSIKSFLYTMVHNRCVDYIRKQKVRTKAATHLLNNQENLEYFDELAFTEMMREIMSAVEELPANMRNILKAYFFEEKKHREIAEALSTSPNAVQLQKAKAIKLLKQKLLVLVLIVLH